MSRLTCPGCGAHLLASAGHVGGEAGCPACGASIVVPAAAAPQPPSRGAAAGGASPDRAHPAAAGAPDPSPAVAGDVPAPRASGAGDETQLPLALAAASLVLPLLAPLAWWLVARTGRALRAGGGDDDREEPVSLRHARFLAMTGTVLLVALALCCAPAVVLGDW